MKFWKVNMKRLIATLLSLELSLSALPLSVFAEEAATVAESASIEVEGESYEDKDGGLKVLLSSAASGGEYVGDFATYNCVSYTVNVPTAGNYRVTLRHANLSSSSAMVNSGSFFSEKITIPATGDWTAYQEALGLLWLDAGTQKITVTNMGNNNWNLDKFTLTYLDSVPKNVELNAYEASYIQNRWKQQRLIDRNGNLSYADEIDADYSNDATLWDLIPDEGGYYIIKNHSTSRYISITAPEGAVALSQNADSDAEKWSVAYVEGRMEFFNKKYPGACLTLEFQNDQPDKVIASTSSLLKWYSSQWGITVSEYGHVYTISGDRIEGTAGTAISTDGKTITTTINGTTKSWTLSHDISASPSFKAENMPIMEAVYNLTLEDAYKNIHNGTYGQVFYTGASWSKVWSRDTAISAQYSLAWVFPEIIKNSLKEKILTVDGRQIWQEDTGTGGSYPTSDDRVILMLASWEYYLATGDVEFLELVYEVTKNTLEQDYHVVYDADSGLMKGETCGLDHREKTYPDWMSANEEDSLINIAESKAASTNIIFAQVLNLMAEAGTILDKPSSEISDWTNKYESLKTAINDRLWLEDRGMYASWEYPEYMGSPVADKVDVLANGYALMYDIGDADRMQSILDNYPMVTYGANTVWPQKTGISFSSIYHNRGVWPGWEGVLLIGAKRYGNNQLAEEVFKSCVRGVAMSLTNKEVINYVTGEGICSDRQLWSVAATLAGYYRMLFGMEYLEDGIHFNPYVPEWMDGPFTIENYAYRGAVLNITVEGKGDVIDSMLVNGIEVSADYVLPIDAKGEYTIEIKMKDSGKRGEYHLENDSWAICPPMPVVTKSANGALTWTENPEYTYKMWTGKEYVDVSGGSYMPDYSVYGAYSLIAIDSRGITSELSKPIVISPDGTVKVYEAEDAQYVSGNFENTAVGYSGTGYVVDKVSSKQCGPITFTITVDKTGKYEISTIYNNYDDPLGSNVGGIRSIVIDGFDVGTMIFPVMQFDFQQSSRLYVNLSAGDHTVKICYNESDWYDTNMYSAQGTVKNDVCFDSLSVRYVGEPTGASINPPVDSHPEVGHAECDGGFFANLWNAIVNFFRSIFGLPKKCVCGEDLV